jgi:hypothetical protein
MPEGEHVRCALHAATPALATAAMLVTCPLVAVACSMFMRMPARTGAGSISAPSQRHACCCHLSQASLQPLAHTVTCFTASQLWLLAQAAAARTAARKATRAAAPTASPRSLPCTQSALLSRAAAASRPRGISASRRRRWAARAATRTSGARGAAATRTGTAARRARCAAAAAARASSGRASRGAGREAAARLVRGHAALPLPGRGDAMRKDCRS